MDMSSRFRIFGIRHHGPGSARSLADALEAYCPDAILIEGPPEADDLIPWVSDPGLKPPVALLLYNPVCPSQAVFYPFAEFSPEWQALRFGRIHNVPLNFIDLPAGLGMSILEDLQKDGEQPIGGDNAGDESEVKTIEPGKTVRQVIVDPIAWAAEMAGYPEPEQWWDHLVEQRPIGKDNDNVFEAIEHLVAALRENTDRDFSIAATVDEKAEANPVYIPPATPYEVQREAVMRAKIREALGKDYQRIAVICGAWHVPALKMLEGQASGDAIILNSLKSVKPIKLDAAWVPWDYERLGWQSGYGAGVESPAWYDLLWKCHQPDAGSSSVAVQWMAGAARLLRDQGLDGSPSHVIEAIRLADMLATVRNRPMPGLRELLDSVQSVFCFGEYLPLQIVKHQLVVGVRTGQVPEAAPQTPLQRDFRNVVKSLRIAMKTGNVPLNLDLRKELDLARSCFLHRLAILDIPWGKLQTRQGAHGTFHEDWLLDWRPEYAVRLIEASLFGTTVENAAVAKLLKRAGDWLALSNTSHDQRLSDLTGLLEQSLVADLPEATGYLLEVLADASAHTADVVQLMEALPPLTAALRYGNVRKYNPELIVEVISQWVERILIGLPVACVGLGDDAAQEFASSLTALDPALTVIRHMVVEMTGQDLYAGWLETLMVLHNQKSLHGLLAGRVARLLFDAQQLTADSAEDSIRLALAPVDGYQRAAAWLEGFLSGRGAILINDTKLLSVIDRWVVQLPSGIFQEILPLLRRVFSTFTVPERRGIAERVGDSAASSVHKGIEESEVNFNEERASLALPFLKLILGSGEDE